MSNRELIAQLYERTRKAQDEINDLRGYMASIVAERNKEYERAERLSSKVEMLKDHLEDMTGARDAHKAESARLREELGYIANAKRKNFHDAEEFRDWAQNRARHALNYQPGTLHIKKEVA